MNKAGTILSEQTALDLLFALPFAAFESASSAVVLALQYLQSNPLALAELTQEHETILRERETKDSGITWKEYKSMTFTHMVINETIRLGNIVPTIFRKVVKDIEIKGRFKSNKPNSSMFNVYMLILYELWVVQIIKSLQVGSFWLVHQQFI
ncbi:hypothetical protein Goshw_006267 [Gossypium schwendimanii]|uniref:Cytochrome P450 n=1 Tax=Gossypium schwendimanii TaxID=34291 RepID=A0A7J9LZB1_GOSSC|nr:hypothetical protein [Gossypium schwendimanii]MBA0863851.1 hypothetical protein [Gossypium schwendimanii]MBA0864028.1 hypothetical protein [Gossypium schwendimanii]MBA0881874.1 hypothetical protein [Gossypium schwendimanii]